MPRRISYYRPPGRADARRAYGGSEGRLADNRFYASAPWRKLRAAFLAGHPLCSDCLKAGRTTAAEHAHHREPRKQRPDLALDWDNLEALCHGCHNARETR